MKRLIIGAVLALLPVMGVLAFAGSADKVDATAQYVQPMDADHMKVCLHLDMPEGWHVNANPASQDSLIPTTVTITADGEEIPVRIDWPGSHEVHVGDMAVEGYIENTKVPVHLDPKAAEAVRKADDVELNIHIQACGGNGMCLLPSMLHIRL